MERKGDLYIERKRDEEYEIVLVYREIPKPFRKKDDSEPFLIPYEAYIDFLKYNERVVFSPSPRGSSEEYARDSEILRGVDRRYLSMEVLEDLAKGYAMCKDANPELGFREYLKEINEMASEYEGKVSRFITDFITYGNFILNPKSRKKAIEYLKAQSMAREALY